MTARAITHAPADAELEGYCIFCGGNPDPEPDAEDGGHRCGYKGLYWRDPATGKLYTPYEKVYVGGYDTEPDPTPEQQITELRTRTVALMAENHKLAAQLLKAETALASYKDGEAVSGLEAMPGKAAVLRAAYWLYAFEEADERTTHSFETFKEHAANASTWAVAWIATANNLLRATAGLPATEKETPRA